MNHSRSRQWINIDVKWTYNTAPRNGYSPIFTTSRSSKRDTEAIPERNKMKVVWKFYLVESSTQSLWLWRPRNLFAQEIGFIFPTDLPQGTWRMSRSQHLKEFRHLLQKAYLIVLRGHALCIIMERVMRSCATVSCLRDIRPPTRSGLYSVDISHVRGYKITQSIINLHICLYPPRFGSNSQRANECSLIVCRCQIQISWSPLTRSSTCPLSAGLPV